MKKNIFLFLLGCLLFANPLVGMKRRRGGDDGDGDRGKKRRKLWNRDGIRLDLTSKKKTKKKKVSKKRGKRKRSQGRRCLETECAICLDEFSPETEVGIFRCGHALCRGCIANLIQRGEPLCPFCRENINLSNIGAGEIEYGLYRNRRPIDGEDRLEVERERAQFSRGRVESQNVTPASSTGAPRRNRHRWPRRAHFREEPGLYNIPSDVTLFPATVGFNNLPRCYSQRHMRRYNRLTQRYQEEPQRVVRPVAPNNRLRLRIRYNENVSWPSRYAQMRVRDEQEDRVLDERFRVAFDGNPVEFQRNADFHISIFPSLIQPEGSQQCAYHALFNAASFGRDNGMALRRDNNAFQLFLNAAINRVQQQGNEGNAANLTSREMENLILNSDSLQPLRNVNGDGLADNVLILDGLNRLEIAIRTARTFVEYEVDSRHQGQINNDLQLIQNGERPQVLRLVGQGGAANYTPRVIAGINRFRNNGTTQIVILNIGDELPHWIVARIFRQNDQDGIEIFDSIYEENMQNEMDVEALARRIYNVFRTDPLN